MHFLSYSVHFHSQRETCTNYGLPQQVTTTGKLELTATYVEKLDMPFSNPYGLPPGSCLTAGNIEHGTFTPQKVATLLH